MKKNACTKTKVYFAEPYTIKNQIYCRYIENHRISAPEKDSEGFIRLIVDRPEQLNFVTRYGFQTFEEAKSWLMKWHNNSLKYAINKRKEAMKQKIAKVKK